MKAEVVLQDFYMSFFKHVFGFLTIGFQEYGFFSLIIFQSQDSGIWE